MEFKEIVKYANHSIDPPEDCSVADLCAYHCMKALIYQYNTKRMSKEYATEQKQKCMRLYERAKRDEDSVQRIFKKQTENINRTIALRIKLNKASQNHEMSKQLWLEAIECIGHLCGSMSELNSATKHLRGIEYEEQETFQV